MSRRPQRNSNKRGRRFETKIFAILNDLQKAHPGLVTITVHPAIKLFNGQIKRPDFELVYRLEQENRELIECQSRYRSSAEIADKIKSIKSLSARNRFVFVFEDFEKLGAKHRMALESDGVNCLSFDDFKRKIGQIHFLLYFLKKIIQRSRPAQSLNWDNMWNEILEDVGNDARPLIPPRLGSLINLLKIERYSYAA